MISFFELSQFVPQSATLIPFRITISAIADFGLFSFNSDLEESLSKVINSSITESLFLNI